MRYIDGRRLCVGCLQQWGILPDTNEVILLRDTQFQAIEANPAAVEREFSHGGGEEDTLLTVSRLVNLSQRYK